MGRANQCYGAPSPNPCTSCSFFLPLFSHFSKPDTEGCTEPLVAPIVELLWQMYCFGRIRVRSSINCVQHPPIPPPPSSHSHYRGTTDACPSSPPFLGQCHHRPSHQIRLNFSPLSTVHTHQCVWCTRLQRFQQLFLAPISQMARAGLPMPASWTDVGASRRETDRSIVALSSRIQSRHVRPTRH